MKTLLLRLAAPIQSWGMDKFERRGTERTPTKSAVIGMIASALGRSRSDSIEDLMNLKFAVRTDCEGMVLRDFQVSALPSGNNSYITNRYYLADAVFLAGLEGDEDLLRHVDVAIKKPYYPLYLGRRSCPPEGQVSLGIYEDALMDVMAKHPLLASDWHKQYLWRRQDRVYLRLVGDAEDNAKAVYTLSDHAISFDPKKRKYSSRRVKEYPNVIIDKPHGRDHKQTTLHDPFSTIKEG